MIHVDRLRDIAGQFEGMIIDQFGVIHDGGKLYPGVTDVLRHLKQAGIPVVILTNSGKRAEANRLRLIAMGIERDLFVDVVSSGEVAFRQLAAGPACRAFIIGRDGNEYGFDTIETVDSPRDAGIMLILGSNAPATSLDQYRKLLAGLRIPALCCNPDKLMLTRHGLQPAPGAIAALYEELGGTVEWVGKPYAAIYKDALRLIGNPSRVLAIGDSAEHDVAGAHNAGLAALLVRTGISTGLETFEPKPDYLMEALIW